MLIGISLIFKTSETSSATLTKATLTISTTEVKCEQIGGPIYFCPSPTFISKISGITKSYPGSFTMSLEWIKTDTPDALKNDGLDWDTASNIQCTKSKPSYAESFAYFDFDKSGGQGYYWFRSKVNYVSTTKTTPARLLKVGDLPLPSP